MKRKSTSNKKAYLIADLEIIEMGPIKTGTSQFDQNEMFCYVKDGNNNHYVFWVSIGNCGESFELFPYDYRLEKYPNINDVNWCRDWKTKQYKELNKDEYEKITLILNKQDYNHIIQILKFSKISESVMCRCCLKPSVDNWWHIPIGGCCCSECLEDLKNKYNYRY